MGTALWVETPYVHLGVSDIQCVAPAHTEGVRKDPGRGATNRAVLAGSRENARTPGGIAASAWSAEGVSTGCRGPGALTAACRPNVSAQQDSHKAAACPPAPLLRGKMLRFSTSGRREALGALYMASWRASTTGPHLGQTTAFRTHQPVVRQPTHSRTEIASLLAQDRRTQKGKGVMFAHGKLSLWSRRSRLSFHNEMTLSMINQG